MSDKKKTKARDLIQRCRAEFGFTYGVPAGVVSDKLRDVNRHADAELLEWFRDKQAADALYPRWEYSGDGNLEHGGIFVKLEDWEHGWCDAVRVTDLDSGCGFRGAVMVEHCSVGVEDAERMRRAWQSCGYTSVKRGNQTPTDFKRTLRLMIAEALLSYGFGDTDDSEILQTESDGPTEFDSWKADKRLHNADLAGYVKAVHLKD